MVYLVELTLRAERDFDYLLVFCRNAETLTYFGRIY
jgi:hypothetical protein